MIEHSLWTRFLPAGCGQLPVGIWLQNSRTICRVLAVSPISEAIGRTSRKFSLG